MMKAQALVLLALFGVVMLITLGYVAWSSSANESVVMTNNVTGGVAKANAQQQKQYHQNVDSTTASADQTKSVDVGIDSSGGFVAAVQAYARRWLAGDDSNTNTNNNNNNNNNSNNNNNNNKNDGVVVVGRSPVSGDDSVDGSGGVNSARAVATAAASRSGCTSRCPIAPTAASSSASIWDRSTSIRRSTSTGWRRSSMATRAPTSRRSAATPR